MSVNKKDIYKIPAEIIQVIYTAMGIKGLFKILKSECPQQFVTYKFEELFGKRIAVDISIFLYRYIRAAGPERWIDPFIMLLCSLKKQGIKTVCIFDGPNPPKEKERERERRRAERERMVSRMKQCEAMKKLLIKEYLPYDKPIKGDIRKECRLLICPTGRLDTTNYNSGDDVINSFNNVIQKLDNQTQPITKEHTKKAMKIVKMLGLACYEADGEAETLCAYLAIKGEVDAVLTEDSDVLAYGTPLMLCFKDVYKLGDNKFFGIHFESVIEDLEMTQEEFRDLCILLSCDYNDRVKGFPPDGKTHKKPKPIGEGRALCMIKEYRRLEEVCNHIVDPSPLIFRRCRELFTIPNKVSCEMVPLNKPIKITKLTKFLEDNQATVNLKYIQQCWEPPILNFKDSYNEVNQDFEMEYDNTKPFYALLSVLCQNDVGKEKCFKVPAKFRNEEDFETIADMMYDRILHEVNKHLEIHHPGYHVDDCVECIRRLDDGYTKDDLWDISWYDLDKDP